MAISTPTIAVETGSTTAATSYATATFNPVANALLVVFCTPTDADDPGTMNISSDIGTMGAWTESFNQPWNVIATPLCRTKIWWGIVGSTPGTAKAITVSGMPDACTGANIIAVSVASGYNTTTPIVQAPVSVDDTSAASQTHTFAAFTGSTNLALSFVSALLATTDPTVDAGWTALGTAISYTVPTHRAHVAYQENASDTTAVWSWTTSGQSIGAGVEVGVAASVTVRGPHATVIGQAVNRSAVM
jgi:hypothetical protein